MASSFFLCLEITLGRNQDKRACERDMRAASSTGVGGIFEQKRTLAVYGVTDCQQPNDHVVEKVDIVWGQLYKERTKLQ